MFNLTKRICSGILALSIAAVPAINYYSLNSIVYAVDESADAEEDMYAFPDELPTATIPAGLANGEYTVPVYMYNIMNDVASMGNGAIGHEAVLSVEGDEYTAHLTFHDMPFLDLYGHLEKLWYYDTEGTDHEVTVEESEWLYNEDTKARVKTIRKCSFILPENSAETKCRVRVDAMGDSEQDARIVFDFSSLTENVSGVDTAALEAKVSEAKAISNDDGKYTEESYSALQQYVTIGESAITAEDLTQELADQLVVLIQGAIDGLVEVEITNAVDTAALEAKVSEAKAISNDDGKYTEESYSALQQYVTIGESAITAEDLTQELADQLVVLIQGAIDGLVENNKSSETTTSTTSTETTTTETTSTATTTVPSREDGIYTANVKFITLESVQDETGLFVLKSTNEENEVLNEIFGNTIKLTIEDNNYTASLTSKGSENSDYNYGYISVIWTKGGSTPLVTYENAGTVTYAGDEYISLVDGTVASFEMRDPGEVELHQYLFTKETDERKRLAVQMVVDYDSLVKIGEVEVDKTALQEEIEFAEYIINNEASKYTALSIQNYASELENAKAVLNDDTVTQAKVREATQALNDAWQAVEKVSDSSNVDTTELSAKLSEAESITNDGNYTDDSFATLQQYITIGRSAITASDLTQETADQLVVLLQSAIDGLVMIETTTTTTTTTTTSTTTTETTTTESTTTTTKNNIASDDDLCKWAINDYKDKTGVTPSNAEITDSEDGKYTITLTDKDGNILDTYVIDPETGIGTNAANEEVNLPQTGNNSMSSLAVALGAFALIGFGMAAVVGSGVMKKKEENE